VMSSVERLDPDWSVGVLVVVGCGEGSTASTCVGEPGFDLWASDVNGAGDTSPLFPVQRSSQLGE
jgi:hypothetical protein